MNVLFLSPNLPSIPLTGGHYRTLGLIRSLSRFASVHVVAIGDRHEVRAQQTRETLAGWGATLEIHPATGPGQPEADEENTERLPDAASHFRSPELARSLGQRFESGGADVAHVEEVVMAQYVDLLACPRVIDRQKVDWAYHEAMARVVRTGSLFHLREAARFRHWERRLRGAFDRMLVPGIGDQRLLEPLHGPGSVSLVPIAIADELRPPEGALRRIEHVLLYGSLDYAPNVEGLQWFFQEVWPGLKAAAPDLRVVIVGSGRLPLSASLPNDPRVEMRGYVPSVEGVLQGPGVLVVPVQVGGGARTKILEALACGMPVVSTARGAENLDLVPGRDFLLAETAAEMTQAILELTREPELVATLGREGPLRAESFRWSRIETLIEPLYREVVAGAARATAARRITSGDSGRWGLEAEVSRLETELSELRRSLGVRAVGVVGQGLRRLRRSSPVWRAESWAIRALDRLLSRPARTRVGRRTRGALVGLLGRVTGRRR